MQYDPRDGISIADVPELPGCRAHGGTDQEASREIGDAIGARPDAARHLGAAIPSPSYWQPRGG